MATTNLGLGTDGYNYNNGFSGWSSGLPVPSIVNDWRAQGAPAGGASPYGIQPSNPSQAQEVASAQGNINSQGVTEAAARAQYGDAAVNNALAKGVTFSNQSAVASAPNTRFLSNNEGQVNPTMSEYQKNPYLDQMAAGITQQMNDNWTRNLAPSIRSGAMAAGGFGGSRQGVVEANALNDLNRSLGQNLTNLYGQDYTNSMNRNLQKYGMDQSYNLGMANNNLGFANLDSNNAQFGANLGLSTLNAQNNWANQNALTANQIAQTPINYFNTFSNNANQIAGQGGTTSQTNQGNPYAGALGGAITGYKLFGANQ